MSEFSGLTPRQQFLKLLEGKELSARELAALINLPVRDIEDHLTHLVKTVERLPNKRFLVFPSQCMDCGFVFSDRKRLTTPSRCHQCRSEFIVAPRFTIIEQRTG